ncbi:N-acetylmuramoyl-L-alanine amidase [Paenibacillus sp. IHBB 3054]|uniref:N-acetylmuramoyl-L-alanine amidase n=1 Tax=Paenibacillus sp. IHBB 3054 TaxID=3425689 RepID=UPI003F67D596
MKKFAFTLLLLLFVLVLPEHGHAAAGNKIYLDGQELTAGQDAPVENVKNSVMVPLRMIAENLGYKVNWDQKSKTVTIEQQGKTIKLIVDQTTASVDDKTVILTAAPVARAGTTLVPIRFVSEQFGLTVTWDNAQKTVNIITPETGGNNTGSEGSSGDGGSTVVVPPAESTSGLTMVNGISFSQNRLTIAMDGSSAPNITKMTGPDRIVVDLPNATFSDVFGSGQELDPNLNGKLAVTDYPDVSGVRYSLYSTSPYTIRFVIDLNTSKNYSLEVSGDASKLIVVDLNAQSTEDTTTQPGNNGRKLVVLDAGHGAKDSGAVGVTGKYEKNFNLAVVLKAAELLKQENKIDVVLTRSDDTFLELKDRAGMANKLKADLFISVHANSSGSSAASGTETYYQREASKALAKVMHKYLVKATGLSDRGVRYGNFHVIRETTMPAVLLEVGYLSNKGDESLLFSETLQNNVAASMVSGIKEYLGM